MPQRSVSSVIVISVNHCRAPHRGNFLRRRADDNRRVQTLLDPKWHLFVRVADLGSVSGAAVALDVPQSMVSRRIAQLERESGSRLFRRTGRGVVLTEFGEQVYPRIVALMRDAEQLADDMRT